ncbi:hypothetical protein CEXT_743651 [Caerostris extrusa]|uniref:Uncharacterized protein n=1 Tax=Caerostris extrusa TaxID=172846 RepID=A0AAV4WVD8_CAEEX|nr:hypothetical protein CEXT_743651 [Caerostris extrusa]
MVRYTDNLKDQIAEISNQFEDDVRIKLAGEQLKIFPANSDIHRAITKYLTVGKIEFYVITPKNQRPLKAVLKGLHVSYSADEIATGLAELGLKIDQVRQLTNLKTKAPLPVWQIVYRKSPENNKIFERNYLAEIAKRGARLLFACYSLTVSRQVGYMSIPPPTPPNLPLGVGNLTMQSSRD